MSAVQTAPRQVLLRADAEEAPPRAVEVDELAVGFRHREPAQSKHGVMVAMLDVVVAVPVRRMRARDRGVQPVDVVGMYAGEQRRGGGGLLRRDAEDLAQARRPVDVFGAWILEMFVFEDAELSSAH